MTIQGNVGFKQIKIGCRSVDIFHHKRSRTISNVVGDIIFKGETFIGHGCKISLAKSGSLYFGDRFKMSAESSIAACNSIVFGDNCLISWDTLVMDSDFHKIFDENGLEINAPQEVVIGDNIWIGC